jgi:hypothetical protein
MPAIKPKSESVPKAMQAVFEAIVERTDAVCRAHLNEEYAQMSRYLAAALCRKRPSPLLSGRLDIWACAIVYTIGSVNFLFDKTQTPSMSTAELCALFGVSPSSAGGKATAIRKMFDMYQMDPDWSLPSRIDDNPLVWMISVDGFIVDLRYESRELQEEALRLGLIPFLPKTYRP